MNIKINGKNYDFLEQSLSIVYILKKLNISKTVIIELNGEIVPKAEFDAIKLKDADSMEILYFMGGG
jgi:thiamine biosynthesis protein ThiS